MLNQLLASPAAPLNVDFTLAHALARATAAIARLDQALGSHPLLPAFLYRVRLDAVRRQAAVDGSGIDPWHLAASIEGLRLQFGDAARIADRGAIFDAARHALTLHQWLQEPDFDQEGEVQRAEKLLHAEDGPVPLLAAAAGFRVWIDAGETRPAMRAALVRFWVRSRLLRAPVPLTGAAAFSAEQDWAPGPWTVAFLHAIAGEAEAWLDLLFNMDRTWLEARRRVAGRRSNSRAPLAIDVMAAMPLISATTLAGSIGMSIKNAGILLERFCAESVAVEVTHRSARRLFGLSGLAPLRDEVRPPKRPEPGRGRGRPPFLIEAPDPERHSAPLPPMTRFERPAIDYSALDAAMAFADQTIRHSRHRLTAFGTGTCHHRADEPSGLAATGLNRETAMSDFAGPQHLGLGLPLTLAQEQFSKAFILSIASLAGCGAAVPEPDIDSIDWTLSCRLPRRPKLDLQVKSLRAASGDGDHVPYPLKRKNYDDLSLPELLAPRLLVLVLMPEDPAFWLQCSPDQLVLRHCAYWLSLAGAPATDNEWSVTVQVPRANLFTVEGLTGLMHRINEGGVP